MRTKEGFKLTLPPRRSQQEPDLEGNKDSMALGTCPCLGLDPSVLVLLTISLDLLKRSCHMLLTLTAF